MIPQRCSLLPSQMGSGSGFGASASPSRSAMSDAALSEPRAATLESSCPSNAMKPSASKTWRGERADVWSSHPAAGMESANARKTGGGRRADVDTCGPAEPMQTAGPSKTWRSWRADVGNSDAGAMEISGPAKTMKTTAASKAGRDRRADVGNSGAVKLMKIAAAEAAVESAGQTGGDGAGVEIRRGANAAGAKAAKTCAIAKVMKSRRAASSQTDGRGAAARAQAPRRLDTRVNRVRRPGTGNGESVTMMSLDRGAAKSIKVERADPTKTVVPLVAALIPAAAVPPVCVVAIGAAELDGLRGR
jgi:hypothetical protein